MKGKEIRAVIQNMSDSQFEVMRQKLSTRKFVPEATLKVINHIREGKSTNKIHELMGWKDPKQFNWITNNIANKYQEYLTETAA